MQVDKMMQQGARKTALAVLLTTGAAIGVLWGAQASAAQTARPVATSQKAGTVRVVGAINLAAVSARLAKAPPAAGSAVAPEAGRAIPLRRFRTHPAMSASLAMANAPEPTAVGRLVAATGASFNGLDHNDQRTLADNGNQFSLEPPDQALAVGGGYVVEAVNNAFMVYNKVGKPLLPVPVSMNNFMNQESEYNRTTGQRGPSLSDPRAYYDAATKRFIVAEWATLNDTAGNPLNISVQFVAVSQTADPTGAWSIYSYETTNADLAGCPCLPDFNQLGGDANGIFITTSLFSLSSGSFVGTKIYALPKAALEAASGGPAPVISFPLMPNDFTVHPTIVPPHGQYATANGGMEYFVEGTADLTRYGVGKAINIFAVSNTSSLLGSSPSLTLQEVTLPSQKVDANLPKAMQMDGPRPLGGPSGLNDPVPLLDAGDARIGSTPYYVNGTIWAVSGTAIAPHRSEMRDGVAWFQVATSAGAGSFGASITNQGIIAGPKGIDLTYPAIAVSPSGQGAIGVTVVGANMFPSTGTIPMPTFSSPVITLSGIGAQPDDGFTAYPQYGGSGVGRWGDYGAAAVDETGVFWFGNEYIPDSAKYPRSLLANWGTYITPIAP